MKGQHQIVLAVLLCSCGAPQTNELTIRKCCQKGQQLDASGRVCVQMPGRVVEDIVLEFIISRMNRVNAYWWPHFLQNTNFTAMYNSINLGFEDWTSPALNATDADVQQLLNVSNDRRNFYLIPFNGTIDVNTVSDQRFCFDTKEDSNQRVFLTSVRLRELHKCCNIGDTLDTTMKKCQLLVGQNMNLVKPQLLNPHKNSSESYWLPHQMKSSVIKFNLAHLIQANVVGNADSKLFLKYFHTRKRSTRLCVDAAAEGAKYQRVFLAQVTDVTKCCRKGEALSVKDTECVAWQNGREERDLHVEDTNLSFYLTSEAQWLPSPLRNDGQKFAVKYGDIGWRREGRVAFLAEDSYKWRVEFSEVEETTLVLNLPVPSGETRVVHTQFFCFEVLAEESPVTHVIVADFGYNVKAVPKCCPILWSLDPDGACEHNSVGDWSPVSSVLTNFSESNRPLLPDSFFHSRSRRQIFHIERNISDVPFRRMKLSLVTGINYLPGKDYCVDVQRTSNGIIPEVFAYVEVPFNTPLYRKVRPLQLLAVVLLVAAVAAILYREQMRRSTHGLALASHAFCLMVANLLQVTWFFSAKTYHSDCDTYAYPIYYFLLAGAFWLHVIAVNMAIGFSRPLGAMAHGEGRGGWWRLALLSVYACGAPAALTALVVYMIQNRREMVKKGYVMPTFFETRTCILYDLHSAGDPLTFTEEVIQRGSLYYYYVPSILLVVLNSVCLLVTICKIRELSKDSSFIRSTSRPLRSALLYVKLLLSAGVLELVMEVTMWGIRLRRYNKKAYLRAAETALMFAIASTFIDLLRAAVVLWLCVGQLEWMGAGWRWLRRRLHWPEGTDQSTTFNLTSR